MFSIVPKKKKNVTKIYKIHLYILDHPETSVSDETSDCFAALSSPPPSPRVKNPCRTTTFQSWTRYRGCRYCCAEDEAYFFGRRGWSRRKGVHGLNSSQRLSNDGWIRRHIPCKHVVISLNFLVHIWRKHMWILTYYFISFEHFFLSLLVIRIERGIKQRRKFRNEVEGCVN